MGIEFSQCKSIMAMKTLLAAKSLIQQEELNSNLKVLSHEEVLGDVTATLHFFCYPIFNSMSCQLISQLLFKFFYKMSNGPELWSILVNVPYELKRMCI